MKKTPLEYSLYLLEMRDRTVGEIRYKLTRREVPEDEIEKVLQFLSEKNFVDDERFVKNYIKNMLDFGKSGKYKIREKLYLLHLDRELIEKELASIDSENERENALELAKVWLNKKKVEPEKRYEKLGRFLAGRGFEIDIVKSTLNKVLK